MRIGGYDVIEVLINWFPMILLVGVWIFFIWRMRSGPYGKYQTEILNLARRQAEGIERIAAALEKRANTAMMAEFIDAPTRARREDF